MGLNVGRILQALFVGMTTAIASNAQAATIHGYSVGSFHSVVDNNGTIISSAAGSSDFQVSNTDTNGNAVIEWGTPQRNGSNGKANSFSFNGNASDTFQAGTYGSTSTNNLFSLGSFDYHNGKTRRDNISQVNFRADLGIDGFMQMAPGNFGSAYLEFTMSINNTNDNNNPIDSADSVWVSGVKVGMTMPDGSPVLMDYDFTTGMDMLIAGTNYNFSLMGFSRDSGQTFESQATSFENEVTNAEIYAMITPVTTTVVPVPAAIWLMGSGLIGLAGLAYRRKT